MAVRGFVVGLVVVGFVWDVAIADVLCRKKNGTIVSRTACKRREAPLNLADFGAVGPPGAPGADGQLRIYGDGSAGNLLVSEDSSWETVVTDGNDQFGDCAVEAGVTLTVPSGTVIRCAGPFRNDGTIVVGPGGAGSVGGGSSGSGPPVGPNPGVSLRAAGGGQLGPDTFIQSGGNGGIGLGIDRASALRDPSAGGGGGGHALLSEGGDGGGGLLVLARDPLVNAGTIRADGANGASGGSGAGAGGVVILASPISVTTTGAISAQGGNGAGPGGNRGAGGGGGGGIVRLVAPTITVNADTIDVDGGTGGPEGTASAGDRIGGGGGGACGGSGGSGGEIFNAPFNDMEPGQDGAAGHIIESKISPTAIF
jgi:hypothetical protein